MEKSLSLVLFHKFQNLIRRLLNHKAFRWSHLILEATYFGLVLIYLFLLMEIEERKGVIILSFMLAVLCFCLVVYVMNLIDSWKDFKMCIDTILIIVSIAFDIYEIDLKSEGNGYRAGSTLVLNLSR